MDDPTSQGMICLIQRHALARDGFKLNRETGLIEGVSVMTVGPATGHGFEITQRTLDSLMTAWQANENGLRSRVTHPETSFGIRDGLTHLVGRPLKPRREGDRVRCDIQLLQAAKTSPEGNLWDWLFDLIEEDPTILGISIVAYFDFDEHRDPKTGELTSREGIVEHLRAVDFVDDPAANRNGLLSTPGSQTPAPGKKPGAPTEGITMNRFHAFLKALGFTGDVNDANAVNSFLQKREGQPGRIDRAVAVLLRDDEIDDSAIKALGRDPKNPEKTIATSPSPVSTAAVGEPPVQPEGAEVHQTQLSDTDRHAIALAERQRITELRNLARMHQLGEDWLNRHIGDASNPGGSTIEAARLDALETVARSRQPVGGLIAPISGGDDNRQTLCTAIEQAITLRGGYAKIDKPVSGHEDFVHLSIESIGRAFLRRLGVQMVDRLSNHQVFEALCSPFAMARLGLGDVALAHSTSDFGSILANVMHNDLIAGYTEEQPTWQAWAVERELTDFRDHQLSQLGSVTTPPRVREGQEYEYGTLSDKGELLRVFKFGQLLSFTWETFINDNLNALNDQSYGFGQVSRALEGDLAYSGNGDGVSGLTDNPTMNEDNTALFHADHNNLDQPSSAGVALGDAALVAMRKAMRLQRGIAPKSGTNARRLNLRPNVLLVPVALEDTAERLLNSRVLLGATNDESNYSFLRTLTLVAESRLDDDSATAYYLVHAKDRACPAAFMCFLRGNRRPYMGRQEGFSVDGITLKQRHVCGFGIGDWRAWQKQSGAVS